MIVSLVHKFLFAFCVFLAISYNVSAQDSYKKLIKVGGYPVFTDGFLRGYLLCFEYEKTFKSSRFYSSAIRMDYNHVPPYPEKYSAGLIALGVGYEFKYYPLSNKKEYLLNGPFVGIYPYYYLPINKKYRYGPGVGTNIGYQQRIGNKVTLSAELNMIYMKNFNEQVPKGNLDDWYFNFNPQIKIGYRL